MSHEAKSRILEEIVIELRKKSLEIPANILSDLKSARTLMNIRGVDSKGIGETEPQIDQYLATVEAYLITEAEKKFAPEKVEKWITTLDLASCESCVTIVKKKEEIRMIPGIPRDKKWIRVEPIEGWPMEKLEQMVTKAKLNSRRDDDGHLIVFGSDEAIKGFVKRISKPTVTHTGTNSPT